MSETNKLGAAFRQTTYQVGGNGNRTVQILQDALADIEGTVEGDVYGAGELIENFQAKMAKYLGKESAVFFPSGTMAQQIALRIWCDQKGLKRVAYHPLCHLEIHEEDGLKELHLIEPVLLGEKNRLIRLDDVQNMGQDIACLLLELPQREIGGQLPAFAELAAISAYCREKGIWLHLDGARLFEVLPYYQKSAAEICELFDSVYVSFYKGIGGIAGAILAGSEAFTKQSKVWKRRHGGDLISLYPYIISSDYYFNQRIPKMAQYYAGANELAGLLNQCHGVATVPEVPVSNMFHLYFDLPKLQVAEMLIPIYQETGLGLTHVLKEQSATTCSCEISIGDRYEQIPQADLNNTLRLLDAKMREALQG